MADNSRSPLRRRLAVLGAAAAALLVSVTLTPGAAVAGPPDSSPKASHPLDDTREVTVMTRNLYLGADLMPVIASLTYDPETWPEDVPAPPSVPVAAAQTWAAVQATNPPERMAAIAAEIAEEQPAVIGLQEVTTWTTYAVYNPMTGEAFGPTVQYDFLELLLKALADQGVVYHEVEGATADNFASGPIPIPSSTSPTTLGAVAMADRDVILRRDDVRVRNAQNGTFENIIEFPVTNPLTGDTTVLPVTRGWGSVDVHDKRTKFRFVNAHLEAFGIPGVNAEELRVLQVAELLAAQAEIAKTSPPMPIVYVGDYNSQAPSAPAYTALVAGVGADAWVLANPGAPGLTCCFDATVSDPTDPLTSRIDLILVSEGVEVLEAEVIGEELADRTASGLWPSDHAGVVATLRFDWPSDRHRGWHHRR